MLGKYGCQRDKEKSTWGCKLDIGFQLRQILNKLMLSLKGKLISWGNCEISLASCIFVANQVIFATI